MRIDIPMDRQRDYCRRRGNSPKKICTTCITIQSCRIENFWSCTMTSTRKRISPEIAVPMASERRTSWMRASGRTTSGLSTRGAMRERLRSTTATRMSSPATTQASRHSRGLCRTLPHSSPTISQPRGCWMKVSLRRGQGSLRNSKMATFLTTITAPLMRNQRIRATRHRSHTLLHK